MLESVICMNGRESEGERPAAVQQKDSRSGHRSASDTHHLKCAFSAYRIVRSSCAAPMRTWKAAFPVLLSCFQASDSSLGGKSLSDCELVCGFILFGSDRAVFSLLHCPRPNMHTQMQRYRLTGGARFRVSYLEAAARYIISEHTRPCTRQKRVWEDNSQDCSPRACLARAHVAAFVLHPRVHH
jgi:hypothetical protein